jgi:N5-(cytidine 5'-diphosphoramidyl)-L-glutamine hydrolase
MSSHRVGITMRIDNPIGYDEPRDCLAQSWWDYLQATFSKTHWLALPNIGSNIQNYVKEWSVDSFIFTGGKDVGSSPKRDDTETILLEMAVNQKIPVLGVCRGMHMLNVFFGGAIIHDLTAICGDSDAHVRKNHSVEIEKDTFRSLLKNNKLDVNSYHRNAVTKTTLAPTLKSFAFSQDGLIEGLFHPSLPILGIQWHPERENPAQDADRNLINTWLEKKGFIL